MLSLSQLTDFYIFITLHGNLAPVQDVGVLHLLCCMLYLYSWKKSSTIQVSWFKSEHCVLLWHWSTRPAPSHSPGSTETNITPTVQSFTLYDDMFGDCPDFGFFGPILSLPTLHNYKLLLHQYTFWKQRNSWMYLNWYTSISKCSWAQENCPYDRHLLLYTWKCGWHF